MDEIKVFAPASVANVGCGYDTIGFAIDGLGDEIIMSKRSDSKLVIKEIIGADLPLEPEENVATISIRALLDHLGSDQGFDITIKKLFKPGSGLGSSASSAAGAVFAANELLGEPIDKKDLIHFALEGEAFASKSYHADNVAPSLIGGFNVIRAYEPELDIFQVNVPADLWVLIIFPDVVIKTSESKKLIPTSLSIKDARDQWSNVAGLIQAFNTHDFELLRKSVTDLVAEPVRKGLIPGYDQVKQLAYDHGSVGFNISGSGPSMFALFKNEKAMNAAKPEIKKLYEEMNLPVILHSSKINLRGCEVIS
ncbi:homoserine kinase [Marinoscillum sp. MHG1-6]|uniref:homoserine kinase n=1 Tax=Marinoscillum sp. MHG1-6 TaxID=2959627 RepID=UPI002158197B|nr:homoserine kinase [Marinoscillum sp. MHG1-6]